MALPDLWLEHREAMESLGAQVRADREQREMSLDLYAETLVVAAGVPVNGPWLSRIERGQGVPSGPIAQSLSILLAQQTPLQAPTPARNSDPATSHQNQPTANTEVHKGILTILKHYPDGLAHFEIIEYYRKRGGIYEDAYPECTDQRIRTATRELVNAGQVVAGDEHHTNSRGRKCKTWTLTPTWPTTT